MRKVIFLDYDGVMTSYAHTDKCIAERCERRQDGMNWTDPSCRDELARVVEATGGGVVFISTWRTLGDDAIRAFWKENSMPGEFIGCSSTTFAKRDSIFEWLREHPECNAYVIIDDEIKRVPDNVLVAPSSDKGLTRKDADEAIRILNKTQ